jgi:type IV secretion system protein VirB10
VLVYDSTTGTTGAATAVAAPPGQARRPPGSTGNPGNTTAAGDARVRSGQFANKSATIAQGTLIPAVLETGFDSTQAGMARALVTQDVRGFDGSRVLVPRGTRLIGAYQSEVAQGQRRALIQWVRLIRPDGATIELDSPATDTVGRSGIKAQVNSHFLERFEGAILQSALQVGVNLASRNTDPAVVLALPGATQSIGTAAGGSLMRDISPTLKVAPGTSISVMVARDLEFPGGEDGR